MKPEDHFIVSFMLSILYFYFTSSFWGAVLCFFVGFFIDLDHLLDFWWHKRKIVFSKEFFEDYSLKTGKTYVLLHSYELLFVFALLSYYLNWGLVAGGALLGMTAHMIMDQVYNNVKPMSYFLIYRIAIGFKIII